ncbi:MAG: MlaE family lipid ABC transporter permease subunit [Oceanicaulis sp.]|uniref:ABC transporter permease n=1 Tax=Glycocaulis sp. TaxID=1969725 RepID=UPI0025C026B9|nr:MlaE family lipid ABC transporter permease subunit [Glycocaulis sp.]MCC5982252.1 MlaE family lipid ABC transporter permease subunit [Oceanicaulis sp.]MCH8521333.1 MlaE family lipid ABC transporter permease subunit [Glycocaulis sp.]
MTQSAADPARPAGLATREADGKLVLEPSGDWLLETIAKMDRPLREIAASTPADRMVIDLSGIGRIDTSGAYMLGRGLRGASDQDADQHYTGDHPTARRLIAEVHQRCKVAEPQEEAPGGYGLHRLMERIGAGVEDFASEAWDTFAFFGRTLSTLAASLLNPSRLRLTPTIYLMETVGINALPIIATLSFFIGAVVAFMGANLLETFGAAVFTVELVGIAVLREFGVLITAIMLAGRSDSAFTASIGSMKMQQEIDAMKVIGLDPYEVLVIPRVIACVVMAPLLTLAAMLAGLFGGCLVAWATLDISPNFFIARLQSTIDWTHFLVGMSKAPVFGLIIAIIGCRQGMKVGGDVESLGARTTASVVQAIFAVIVVDALFAMMYLELDI